MLWRVDWVAPDGRAFAVVAHTSSWELAVGDYETLCAVASSEGVLQATTEAVASRACSGGEGDVPDVDPDKRAYFMRVVLPAARPTVLHEELPLADAVQRAGG